MTVSTYGKGYFDDELEFMSNKAKIQKWISTKNIMMLFIDWETCNTPMNFSEFVLDDIPKDICLPVQSDMGPYEWIDFQQSCFQTPTTISRNSCSLDADLEGRRFYVHVNKLHKSAFVELDAAVLMVKSEIAVGQVDIILETRDSWMNRS